MRGENQLVAPTACFTRIVIHFKTYKYGFNFLCAIGSVSASTSLFCLHITKPPQQSQTASSSVFIDTHHHAAPLLIPRCLCGYLGCSIGPCSFGGPFNWILVHYTSTVPRSSVASQSDNQQDGAGTCQKTSSCTSQGFNLASYCPNDPTDVQCCVKKTCSTASGSGICLNTGDGCSGGSFIAGACPGDSTIKVS